MPNQRPWFLISSKTAFSLFQKSLKVIDGLIQKYQVENSFQDRELLNDSINLIRMYAHFVESEQIACEESVALAPEQGPSPVDYSIDETNLLGLATIAEIYASFKNEE